MRTLGGKFGWLLLGPLLTLGCEAKLQDGGETPALAKAAALSQRKSKLRPPAMPAEAPVKLDGSVTPGAVTLLAPGFKRIYAARARVWVYEQPDRSSRRLGYLRAGASTPTTGENAGAAGCPKGWFRIFPEGFVCASAGATFDVDHPVVAALSEHPPDYTRTLPYIYGTVRNPGPVYGRLPNERELRRAETSIDDRMPRWFSAGGEIGASYAQHVWLGHGTTAPDPKQAWLDKRTDGVPGYLQNGGIVPNLHRKPRDEKPLILRRMRPKVGHAFVETFFHEGRRYGVTTELEVLPTDRLRPIQGSDFHGFGIGKDVEFPFALVRAVSARYRNGERAEYRSAVALTGKQLFFDGVLHYETKDGRWLSDRVASRIEPASKMPGWAVRGEKWIDVNLTKQSLMLYEGTEPVYVTLISSGEAGLEDPDTSTATKRGIFRIHTKHITTTMASNEIGEEFELRDVPYVQYFDKEGYALHGAYWHDRFGMPKSHGCINLSPEDARRVFYWTEPRVPPGWHGALLPLKGTVIFIHP